MKGTNAYLYCNVCYDVFPGCSDYSVEPGIWRKLRKQAKEHGWRYSKGKDYCDICFMNLGKFTEYS